nr:nucleocapsid protein [Hipposideros bat coronavirus]
MASVSFENNTRGRQGRVPLSFYAPLIIEGDQPFYKVIPNNLVPTGKGSATQQIGYWNEQTRWRMNKGQRKNLPSKFHFYYLGTGPHAAASFRSRIDGVKWVAKQGSKTDSTGLGTRKKNNPTVVPHFDVKLPQSIKIVDDGSQSNSRAQSNSRDQSGNRSQSRSRNQSRNNSQQNSQSQSRNRSRSSSSAPDNRQVDIVEAVKLALQQLGVSPAEQQSKKSKSKNSKSGSNTPKPAQPKTSPSVQRRQVDRPVWKRTPSEDENVTVCFGPRDSLRNFGDKDLVSKGVSAPHYPQIAELAPSTAAILFGSEVSTREAGDDVEITYTYKMRVPKTEKNLPAFLQQVSAYAQSPEPMPTSQLNPSANDFKPMNTEEVVEIINQVYDSFEA